MPSEYKRLQILKDPGLADDLASVANYAKRNGLTKEGQLARRLIREGCDAVRQRELMDALTVNAPHRDDSIAEAALKTLTIETELD